MIRIMTMNFLTFLKENYNQSKAHIVLQKMADMIDDGHVEYNKDKIDINLGRLIKDATLYDLHVLIRKAKENSVKLGKNKLDDKISIVIDTNYYPQRQNLRKLFAREEVVKGFEDAFTQYMKSHHTKIDHEEKSHYETSKEMNTPKGFENAFKDLEGKIKDKISEYKKAKAELENETGKSALASHKATHGAALERLKIDMLGNSAKEFVSKMLKLADAKLMAHIDNNYKKKLTSRLISYYEHNFL